jgi:hypothetical protein
MLQLMQLLWLMLLLRLLLLLLVLLVVRVLLRLLVLWLLLLLLLLRLLRRHHLLLIMPPTLLPLSLLPIRLTLPPRLLLLPPQQSGPNEDRTMLFEDTSDASSPRRHRSPKRPWREVNSEAESEDDSEDASARRTAHGNRFRTHLLAAWRGGHQTAKAVCTIAFLALQAGACGIADIAIDPDKRGSNQSRKLTEGMGFSADAKLYYAPVPVWDISTSTRVETPIPFDLPFLRFHQDHQAHPRHYKAIESEGSVDYTSSFRNHVVVQEHGEACCFLVGLYSDDAAYLNSQGRRDSILIVTWNNLRHPATRHVICVLRNRDRCGCGCKGQCTLMAIWRVICWALNMLAQGEFPVARHDGTALGSYHRGADFDTKALGPAAGTTLSDSGLHGVTCQFRADIAEMTKSLGFKGVSSNRPCFLCDCMYGTMFELPPSLSSPTAWKNTDQTTYNDRLARSRIFGV